MNKGEIWLAKLPILFGKEQAGIRPCLVLVDTDTGLVIVIPLTTNFETLKYPNTLEIKYSKENNLQKDSIALLFQMRAIDRRRLSHKIGNLEDSYMLEIDNLLKNMFKL